MDIKISLNKITSLDKDLESRLSKFQSGIGNMMFFFLDYYVMGKAEGEGQKCGRRMK